MKSFEELYGMPSGFSLLALGPPGTGKSTIAGSVCSVVPPERVRLLCPKPRERRSFRYVEHGLNRAATVFSDVKTWKPAKGRFAATGWAELETEIEALLEDEDYDAVIVDPLTDAFILLEHAELAAFRVGSTKELGDSFGYYDRLRRGAMDFIETLVALTDPDIAARPKFVIATVHTQPPKESPTGTSADVKAVGIEYGGKALPQVEGAYRRKMVGDFDIAVFTQVKQVLDKTTKPPRKVAQYLMQVLADHERHAKVALLPAEALEKTLPNDWNEIYRRLVG